MTFNNLMEARPVYRRNTLFSDSLIKDCFLAICWAFLSAFRFTACKEYDVGFETCETLFLIVLAYFTKLEAKRAQYKKSF